MSKDLASPGSAEDVSAATVSPSVAVSPAGHTPGPWRVDPSYPGDIQTERGEEIASCFKAASLGRQWIVGGVIPWSEAQANANAHLVSAAPELLSALIELIGDADHRLGGEDNADAKDAAPLSVAINFGKLRRARAAIAKATGQ